MRRAAEQPEREAQPPPWRQLNERLREPGRLVASRPLHPVASATTVRVRDGETEPTTDRSR
jgi:hypothetical protein